MDTEARYEGEFALMAKTGQSRAEANRAIRQQALREQLAEQCRFQHVLDNIQKMEDLATEMDSHEFNRIKAANEQRIKLIGKYLPDLKSIEINATIEDKTVDSASVTANEMTLLRELRKAREETPSVTH